jgi:hypothetical protein
VALGASNLKKCVKHFMDVGYDVIDLTIPGWVVSAANVENLMKTIKDTNIPSNAKVVLDLFGNSACRWAQEDGTEALPVRTGSGYHLPGPVSACSDRVFTKLIEITLPLFLELHKNEKIILPPLPRYLFRGCCRQDGHATNVSEEGHEEGMLEGFARLRSVLKKHIVSVGLDKAWVSEGVRDLVPPSITKKDDILMCLQEVCMQDGVHYTNEGYATLTSNIHSVLKDKFSNREGMVSAAVSVSEAEKRSGTYYWRGFLSPTGSSRLRGSGSSYKMARAIRLPPYARTHEWRGEEKMRGGGSRGRRGYSRRGRGRRH